LAELLTPHAFREPGKDWLYDSPYAIAVYFVVTVFALTFWIVEQVRINKNKLRNGKIAKTPRNYSPSAMPSVLENW
jgi:hypothetical protein